MSLPFHADMNTYKTSPALYLSNSSTFSVHLYCYTLYILLYLLIKLAKGKKRKKEKKGSSPLFLWCLEERSCTLHITIYFQPLHLHHLFLWSVICSVCKETINLARKPLLNDLLKSVSLLYCSSLLFLQVILQMLFLASFNEITLLECLVFNAYDAFADTS